MPPDSLSGGRIPYFGAGLFGDRKYENGERRMPKSPPENFQKGRQKIHRNLAQFFQKSLSTFWLGGGSLFGTDQVQFLPKSCSTLRESSKPSAGKTVRQKIYTFGHFQIAIQNTKGFAILARKRVLLQNLGRKCRANFVPRGAGTLAQAVSAVGTKLVEDSDQNRLGTLEKPDSDLIRKASKS